MSVQLLVTGDIHIGRRPTRVPDADLAERASAARMWGRIVLRAIDERVDAVLLSGDIVDHENRLYEATGPLERGIIRLAEAGIQTYAVAGNHDWDVLPRILKQLVPQRFCFLGQGGRWDESHLEREGRRVLRIVGWSFPDQYVPLSPLDDFPVAPDPQLPTIGLLHADVDASNSKYCPVRLSELQASRVSLWVLGHVHKPQEWPSQSGAYVLNPGSPQALAPDEPGPHGPWLVKLNGARSVECRQLSMSLVRYEECDVDLAGAATEDDFQAHVNDAMLNALDAVTSKGQPPELLSLRLNLKGATSLCGRIDSLARNLTDLERTWAGVTARVDKYTNLTRPVINLTQVSQQNDLLGALARTLIALEQDEPGDTTAALLSAAAARLQEVYRAPAYRDLAVDNQATGQKDAQAVLFERGRRILLAQGWQLLEVLRSQVPQEQELLG